MVTKRRVHLPKCFRRRIPRSFCSGSFNRSIAQCVSYARNNLFTIFSEYRIKENSTIKNIYTYIYIVSRTVFSLFENNISKKKRIYSVWKWNAEKSLLWKFCVKYQHCRKSCIFYPIPYIYNIYNCEFILKR